ncbi:MAG TPA: hypothetical protein ENF92_07020 [Desulfobacteraceae bacterium]|nr:cell division protein FtsL [Deltaproteobacteria bacterium]HDM10250.1 hypothetical protein [Desulfobacteraceae bacterium]
MTGTERVNSMVRSRNARTGIRIVNTKRKRKPLGLSGKQLFFVVLMVFFLLVTGIGFVWSNFETTQLGYNITQLKKEELRLRDLNKKLRLELAYLKSPQNLHARATRCLGLRQPAPEQIVVLP